MLGLHRMQRRHVVRDGSGFLAADIEDYRVAYRLSDTFLAPVAVVPDWMSWWQCAAVWVSVLRQCPLYHGFSAHCWTCWLTVGWILYSREVKK